MRPKTSGIPLVNGDPDRLHQVLLNLVSNGMRHAGDDATVTIQLRDGEGFIYIDVIDDGKGMEDEVAAHIFERFYRADSSRTRDTGGSGLGLAIAKSLVEQHGGTLSVTSELGVGSTFTVALPAVPQPADAPSDPTAEPATFTGTAVPVSEKKAKKKLRTKPWSRSKSKEKSRGDFATESGNAESAPDTPDAPQGPR
ncbi:sensor histidine kinase [Corynebacterium phoceense]|uniref:sensor histidine kinase n=1 Tax=Corynebacterium phoceense TaxID=1686286 RepID=UPI00215C0B36|nr:ATP-binding protein [Corynebacterium phoceense]